MGFNAWFREWRKKRATLPFKPGPCSTYDHMLASATEKELLALDKLIKAHKKQQARSSDP